MFHLAGTVLNTNTVRASILYLFNTTLYKLKPQQPVSLNETDYSADYSALIQKARWLETR